MAYACPPVHRHRRAPLAAALLLGLLPLLPPHANAASVPWHSRSFKYVADRKDLKEVLRDLSASQSITTWISPEVTGTLSGKFEATPQKFLDDLSGTFGFVWYYDGSVLRIWGANETKNATLSLGAASTSALRDALARMRLDDPRFPVRYDETAHLAVVSGPPGYVDTVAAIAKQVEQVARQRDATEVQVFQLHYAQAADHTTRIGGQDIQVPGMASLLRNIYGVRGAPTAALPGPGANFGRVQPIGGGSSNTFGNSGQRQSGGSGILGLPASWFGAGSPSERVPVSPPLPGSGNSANAPASVWPEMSQARRDAPLAVNAGSGGELASDAPVIEADPRTNGILIRDRPERMAAYGTLIQQLDNRPKLLQIDATIIEIRDGALQDLGVDWRFHSRRVDVQTGDGRGGQLGYDGSLSGAAAAGAAAPLGGTLTAVLGDAGRYLMTRVSALEQTNKAKIVSTPQVATLDNVEAVMDHKQQAFVRVSGYASADLYNLSAGVSLRVLPSVVPGSPNGQMRLDVRIEDGQLGANTVDGIPVITSSEITTQAFVNEGQSLLIAGYASDTDQTDLNNVPGLSRIPLVGNLFKHRQQSGSRLQRLFLLTPHIVSP
ncbi:type III secretion system outer membrane ring subunit SctC [Xanthomonas campestris pv. incanae]|uniref:type III secretion system outer membrane ring subunit SctC n=1 Tax=Xanthomonas campestris TaxID=339 RepID=UPI002367B062|nr:type III secretion system outer membrane ring subunit SctC [Xanthomonas campestris]WDJ86375.1 type III secretion system outer membrane ring subunit SctC [Xanthomonas campestris pv. incanae]WDJ95109.1 type III secretion system outer membrane ring subunit SctC [Xanthomonas campestris pv. incanae]WDJ99399.1 type III secretion system outer membrane ring subunit SctC [Xanthomonas campestris pv. incanae]WDK24525.1 type III secretion system outer membrane ring subunit SctC [Xanthomonas campestris p